MLESVYIFIRLLLKIYTFIQGANPNNISLKGEKEKELFDPEYSANSTIEETSFGSFITYYNILEETIKNFAQKQLPEKNNNIQFLDSLSILKDLDIISEKCYAQINELRLYRNSLVHSTEDNKIVNPTLFEILKNICNLFLSLTDASDNNNSCSEVKGALDNYINSLPSNIDEKMLCFLIDHPRATIQDIAGSLNITVSATKRKLQKLITYGYVEKQRPISISHSNLLLLFLKYMVLSHLTILIIMEYMLLAITNGNLVQNGVKVVIKSYMLIQIQMISIALLDVKTFQIYLIYGRTYCLNRITPHGAETLE